MSLGNDPQVHFIEDGRFVCKATPDAPCRNYPACECEGWDVDVHGHDGSPAAPGHENVPQDECWMEPWINATDLVDSHEGEGYVDDRMIAYDEWPDGAVVTEWQGDYLTWDYAVVTA